MGKFLDILLKRSQQYVDSFEDTDLPPYDGESNIDTDIVDYQSLITPERTNTHTNDASALMMTGLLHDLNEDRQTRYVGSIDPVNEESQPMFYSGMTSLSFTGSTGFISTYRAIYDNTPKEEKVTFLNKKK